MPRRKPHRTGNKQHSKSKKRPRGWHRRAKKPISRLWRELKREKTPPKADGTP